MTRNLSVLSRVSSLAVAAVLTAGAAAQSFQGTPTTVSGDVFISEGAGTTDIMVNSTQAVIDWTPDDNNVGPFGAIDFQPSGTVATFEGFSDFAVLNRLNVADPSRIVALNGTINSRINGQTGGSVYFYSPSGFVLTGTSIINVGSLVLSASPITVDINGDFINPNNNMVEFGVAPDPFGNTPNPNASITTVSDISGTAQINSSGAGNYVALVAPQIHHQGDIRTDGTAALVAAEAATIRFDPFGLFDIQVTVGTDTAQGIHVDGGTIGRNDPTVASSNVHRAYLVAVAKNDAVTMLVNNGASIGFEIGTSATVEDNAVVISGGYNLFNGGLSGSSGVSQVDLTITNATLSSDVNARVSGGAVINSGEGALSFGGNLDIYGGEATTVGGNVLIDALNGNPLTIGGDLYARAFRRNGDGSQTGLITRLGATGGSTLTVGGNVRLDSDSFGAFDGSGNPIPDAIGGSAQVNIGAGSTLNVGGDVWVHADGYGGDQFSGGTAGNGIGGQALVMAILGGATVNVTGSVYASANGYGGSAGECSSCGVLGGSGIGGNASVHTNSGATNSLTISGDVSVEANGYGGAGDAQGGSGLGGTANLQAGDGSSLTVLADTSVDASGYGGYGFDSATGGLGRGGTARIGANGLAGSTVDLAGPVFVSANGLGGDGLNGGVGTGGIANVNSILGTLHITNDLQVVAISEGGNVTFGSGTGGAGLADNETAMSAVMTEASVFASGGTLTVDGMTVVSANAYGGDGGFDGGSGGNAIAAGVPGVNIGGAVIHATNNDSGPSVIQLADVFVTADAEGGAGGHGPGGVDGGNGGNGGSATGGKAVVTAAAGSGNLTAGATILSASATGGRGGDGGGADGGNGGNAGDGGDAFGGFINVGTESGNPNFALAANNGTADYVSITAFATATGGDGGNAGFGNVAGLAGDGGDASGGNSVLLVRGSAVTVDDVFLDASAYGGNGGLDINDSYQGSGGGALTGSVGVLVTNRFQLPDQRGTLNAGNITGTALAIGGSGATAGGEWTRGGGALFEFVNSEGTIDGLHLTVTASDGIHPDSTQPFVSRVAIVNSTVNIAGDFTVGTPGDISVHVDDSDPQTTAFTAQTFNVAADNFVHDATRPLPANVGTISAGSISLTTNGDLIVDAHLDSTSDIGLFAPGLVDVENVTSGGFIGGSAGTSLTAGNLSAADYVSLSSNGSMTLGSVDAGTYINIFSFAGDIFAGAMSAGDFLFLDGSAGVTTGNLDAANDISVQAGGNIMVGDATSGGGHIFLTAGGDIFTGNLAALFGIELDAIGDITFGDSDSDTFDFDAGGSVTGGNIIAGTSAGGEASGAVTIGDINVGILRSGGVPEDDFAVGFVSATSINVGNVEADDAIGFATFGNLTTGALASGVGVMTLIGGDTTIASINTPGGIVYHGDAQMFIDAGGPDNFDPLLVLGQPPVPSGGSYTVTGAILTGQMQVASATDISTGDIFASESVAMAAGGSIATGDIEATSIDLLAGGDIDTGDLNTQVIAQLGGAGGIGALLYPGASITLESGGDITTGDISSIDGVYLNAGGSILTGMINAVDFIEALAGGNITTDALTAGDYIALMAGGSVNIGNSTAGGTFQASAGGNFASAAISAPLIDVSAGGTAAINGIWSADYVQLASNDINITANGRISAAEIDLISSNATQTVVGDGVAGGGYQLSDAEFDRLDSGNIDVIADAGRGAAPKILIGNLSVTAPGGGGSEYEFVTYGAQGETIGSIRIVGNALFSGMGPTDGVAFSTNLFELDAATGLLSLENTPGTLGGVIYLDAAHIHVASGQILDRLASEPRYAGYQDDLNAPAAVHRPDGVIRAGSIEIEFYDGGAAELNTLYVQNTGTAVLPAGFLVSDAVLFGEGSEVTPPPGSIDLIINGQIRTQGGTLTGVQVRDALVGAEGDLTPFTSNSTINGCLLTGPCLAGNPGGPFPPGITQTPGIQQEIILARNNLLPPPEFGNEDFIDDNLETTADGATSPITPPAPLFDTSELGGKSDVDDPVSGSGNPALMENAGENACPAGASQEAGQCEQENQQ